MRRYTNDFEGFSREFNCIIIKPIPHNLIFHILICETTQIEKQALFQLSSKMLKSKKQMTMYFS